MNIRKRVPIQLSLMLLLRLMLCDTAFGGEPPTPGSSDLPADAKRLTDARLVYHRSDPKLVWSFGPERFVLEIGGKTVPVDLIKNINSR